MVGPDLIVFEHTPLGLLAARGLSARRVLIGTGFTCPPDTTPLPIVRTSAFLDKHPEAADPIRIAADEQRVLNNANWMLARWSQPPLQRLGQLYGEIDDCLLTTFKELDHCRGRVGGHYLGPITASGGECADWPKQDGKRIFGYLKPFPALERLLTVLRDLKTPTLIYPDGIPRDLQTRFTCPTLRFQHKRPDPAAIARECDLAILNGTHGTVCDLLRAGKPTLQVPLYGEQDLTAEAVQRMGAGEVLSPRSSSIEFINTVLDQLLTQDRYRIAAAAFAERYRDFDPDQQRMQLVDRTSKLLPAAHRAQVRQASPFY